jgi:hypothetical protein
LGHGELAFPDQPRPGADVHRPRPGARLRDIAAGLGITERSAYGIVTELAETGYVVKQKDGRPNRYQIQAHLPLPEPTSREHTVGEIRPSCRHRRDAVTGRRDARKPPQARHIATTVEPGPAGVTNAGTLHGRQPPPHYLHAARLPKTGSCLPVLPGAAARPSSRIFSAPSLTERAGEQMSSPSRPAHLSNHQRNTLRQIFQHPAGHNIEWRAVLSLLAAIGSCKPRSGTTARLP